MYEAAEFAKRLTSDITKRISKKHRDDIIARKLNVSEQTFKNYKYQNRTMPFQTFLYLVMEFNDITTVNSIAEKLNCVVYQLPKESIIPNLELLKRATLVMQDAAKTVDSVVESIKDNKYDEKEKAETKEIIKETLKALIALDISIDRI